MMESDIKVFTLNLQMYKGGAGKQLFTTQQLLLTIKCTRPDIIFFQEECIHKIFDSGKGIYVNDFTKISYKKIEDLLNIEGYVLISMCEYDHYYKDDHATILLNTIYIKKSNLINNYLYLLKAILWLRKIFFLALRIQLKQNFYYFYKSNSYLLFDN